MSWEFEQYRNLITDILTNGEKRDTRAGKAYSVFGKSLTIDMTNSFPVLLGRKMFIKPVLGELAAFLGGPKNVQDFKDQGCNYWDKFSSEQGELDLDYGNAWLDFNGVNQLQELVDTLKRNPTDRRMIVSGWRPDRLKQLSLPCCHMLYQWYVRDGKYLDMMWYQRSVDTMIGLPSDIILAATWNALLANEVGLTPGKLTFFLGDTHIYANHMEGVADYLRQVNYVTSVDRPKYSLAKEASVFNFTPDMLVLEEYNTLPAIKFDLNV